jgi:hypothetical protein
MLEVSLLDDARFLEELAKIEALPPEDTSVFPKPVPTVGGNQPPTAITDELPPALGPRTKGPQFVLAPPPSKRKSSYRSSKRSAARVHTIVADEAPDVATATENIAATASDYARASSEEQGSALATATPQLAEKNPETEASLSAFASESARAAASTNTERQGVRDSKRPAPLHPMLAVVGFLLMMSVGAGAAALVFHDRVTQIVQLLERSAERR